MKRLLLLLLGLVLLGILSYFCFLDKASHISKDIVTRTKMQLASNGMDWVNPSIKGDGLELTRIVTLNGVAPSKELKQKASEVALAVDGVYDVDNRLLIKKRVVADDVKEVKVIKPKKEEEHENNLTISPPVVIDQEENETNKSSNIEENTTKPVIEENVTQPVAVEENETKPVVEEPQEVISSQSCQDELNELLANKKIHFKYDRFEIDPSSYALLDNLIEVINRCPQSGIIVAGHTDSKGRASYNLQLSQRRADVVENYIISNGVDKTRVKAVGYGEESPIADNSTDEGRAQNRRIEFDVVDLSEISTTNLNENRASSEVGQTGQSNQDNSIVLSCEEEFKNALLDNKIHFDSNSATIKQESYALLDQLVDIAKRCQGKIISIQAHTDSIGSKSFNQKLSLKRANAVKDYFIKHGVDESSLESIGYGESRPLVSNMLKDGRAKNRRIEFKIKGEK